VKKREGQMSKNFFQMLIGTLTATQKIEKGKENWGSTYWRQELLHCPQTYAGIRVWGDEAQHS